jgi:transposase-like protein
MNTNKQGRDPIYETSLKVAIAREYLTSDLGYTKLAKKYNLPGEFTVRYFVKWYRKRYPDPVDQQVPGNAVKVDNSATNGDLEKQLKEANLKIAGLEMLIEIAQKDLGIDLVKKLGTKQSQK